MWVGALLRRVAVVVVTGAMMEQHLSQSSLNAFVSKQSANILALLLLFLFMIGHLLIHISGYSLIYVFTKVHMK